MQLLRNEFARDAFEFCRALAAVSTTIHHENKAGSTALTQWKLVQTNIHGIDIVYLTHVPVIREVSKTLDESSNDAFLLEEPEHSSLLIDNDTVIHSPQPPLSVWKISIVYSDTWMVPVLYFSVTRNDNGMPFSRNEILAMLDTHDIEDTWQFVSYQEHPITGEPSCFLHPCQTAQRLDVLNQSQQQSDKLAAVSAILSWLTMMLPAIGFRIPPKTFSQLQHYLIKYKV